MLSILIISIDMCVCLLECRVGHTVSVIYTNNLNKYVCLSVRM